MYEVFFQKEYKNLKSCELRGPFTGRERVLGLHKDLLQAILVLVELVVDLGQVLQGNPVRNHLQGIDLAPLYLLHELLPVLVDRCLAVSDEPNASLH